MELVGRVRTGRQRRRSRSIHPSLLVAAVTASAAFVTGTMVADGRGEQLAAAIIALVAAVMLLTRPSTALLLFILAVLSYGADFTRISVGSVLYISDVLLAFFVVAALVTLQKGIRPAWSGIFVPLSLLWIFGALSFLFHADTSGVIWLQNVEMVLISLYALFPGIFLTTRHRDLLKVVIAGCVFSIAVVIWYGLTGHVGDTSTGAVRVDNGNPVPLGVGFIVVVTFVACGVLSRRWLFVAPLFIVGLLLVNHRSSFVGTALAMTILIFAVQRLGARLALVGAVAAVAIFVAFAANGATPIPGVESSLQRAGSIGDSADPNINYRENFWKNVVRESLKSPVLGQGFQPYPDRLVPPHSTTDEENPHPHNSFVELMYRIGPLPALALIISLLVLVLRALWTSRTVGHDWLRAGLMASAISVLYIGVHCFFNVGLEVPYTAAPFWLAVGIMCMLLRQASFVSVAPQGRQGAKLVSR